MAAEGIIGNAGINFLLLNLCKVNLDITWKVLKKSVPGLVT